MTENTGIAIGIIEAESRTELEAAETAEDMLRAAFKVARNHWMFTDEEDQLRGGIGAAMHHMNEDDVERVKAELKVMNALGSAIGGVPVDFAAVEVPENPIGIRGLWIESKST